MCAHPVPVAHLSYPIAKIRNAPDDSAPVEFLFCFQLFPASYPPQDRKNNTSQTANSCRSRTTIATDALFAASATRFISFRRELAGSSGLSRPHVGVFLGIEPRLLVEVGVGFGARSFDSLADPLLDDGEGIMRGGGIIS